MRKVRWNDGLGLAALSPLFLMDSIRRVILVCSSYLVQKGAEQANALQHTVHAKASKRGKNPIQRPSGGPQSGVLSIKLFQR